MLYKISHFTYDDSNGIIKKETSEIQLTKTQRKLFNYFIENPKTTISKETLMEKVWDRVVTKNSIERTLSILRANIEVDSSDPKILITHFGHGVSFEGKVSKLQSNDQSSTKDGRNKLIGLAVVSIALIGFVYFYIQNQPHTKSSVPLNNQVQNIPKNQPLIILPTVFENSTNNLLEQGSNELIRSTIDSLDTQGQVWFDESDKRKDQVIEKNWKIDKDLVVIQSKVVKNGEVYDVVVRYTKGYEIIKTQNLTAKNVIEATNLQLQSVSQLYLGMPDLKKSDFLPKTDQQKYLEALGYQKNKNYKKSVDLLNEILSGNENSHLVRYTLADVLLDQQKFDEALAQLMTLKNTELYQKRGASIEYLSGIILRFKNQNKKLVENNTKFLNSHLGTISPYQRAKLILQKARAHMDLGNMAEALRQYKLCIIDLDERLYPDIYSGSYLGQGIMLALRSTDDEVIDFFYKAVEYAERGDDLRARITTLNALSNALYSKNNWQEGIKVIKKSIALMDAENAEAKRDQSDVAYGLGVLSMYLYERGLYTESETILKRLSKIANDMKSDSLLLLYYNNQAYLEVNKGSYEFAQIVIDKLHDLGTRTENYAALLNYTFVQLELLLQTNDTDKFTQVYNEQIKLFEPKSLERYKIYMHWFLARHNIILNKMDKARKVLVRVSEQALSFKDSKLYVDAQNSLAKSYLSSEPKKALDILNNVVEHEPNPNPYLWIKAKALVKLNKNLEAINTLNQAKLGYNEAWSAKNQKLLDDLLMAVKS